MNEKFKPSELAQRLQKGLDKAYNLLLEKAKKNDEVLVIAKEDKVTYIKARDIK